MKHNTVLIVLSLLNALFFGLHLTGDIFFGIEKGGREILIGVLILAVYLYGAVALPERLAGYIILLLGGLASAARSESGRARDRRSVRFRRSRRRMWG